MKKQSEAFWTRRRAGADALIDESSRMITKASECAASLYKNLREDGTNTLR